MQIWELSANQIAQMVRDKEISAQEVLDTYLSRIEEIDPKLCAYIEVLEPDARFMASRVDAAIMRGEDPGPLAGVPIAVKDNINMKDTRCSCGSRILENYISPYDATCISRLKSSGATIIGKTNLDEFAMGSSTETSAFGPSCNPWDTERVPGGSSGGSAAAVSGGIAAAALGSDTGGSIRQPAAFTGTCGMKPTYGLVSRYGLVAFASSLDQIGPIGTSVRDCAMLLDIIMGYDPMDSTSNPKRHNSVGQGLKRDFKGLRVGVPKEYFNIDIEPGVYRAFRKTLSVMSEFGAEINEVGLPHSAYALDTYHVIALSEASSNLARFDGVRYGLRVEEGNLEDMYKSTRGHGFGKEVLQHILLGTYFLSAGQKDKYYLRAAKVRTLIKQDFDKAFQHFDILVSPTTPTVAFRKGEEIHDPLSMYVADAFTVPVNLAGIPAISIPCGFALPQDHEEVGDENIEGLPVGFQIMGRPFDDGTVLAVACAIEEALGEDVKTRTVKMRGRLHTQKECEPVV
jgi:aspartyl-tRNA(Asn)/glutamyl-tRNA(Gln) amidotransferase subunit A